MQEAVRDAYRARTGRRISMAPRPVAADSAANAMLGLSRDMATSERATPGVAKPNAKRSSWWRAGGIAAVAFAAGAAAVVAIAATLVRPVHSSSARGTDVTGQVPPVVSSTAERPQTPPSVPARSAAVDEPSAAPPEPPAEAVTEARSAGTAGAAPTAPAPRSSAKPGCATPFVVDPVTHIKHWRVDCL
jgi:hypothetical protein